MSEFPTPIRDFILALTEDMRTPAYLLVSDDEGLSRWGGDLAAYDIYGLKENMDIGEVIPFMTGLLPLESHSLYLPNIQTKGGQYADVYFFQRDEGTWILFLDASAEATRQQTIQQKASNLNLQVAELEREGAMLHRAQSFLEEKVRERTVELADTNQQLKKELAERKRIEAALRASESRFRRLFESNMIGIMFWDLKGIITEANSAFLKMLGFTADELTAGQIHWDQVTSPENLHRDEQAFTEMRDTGACRPYQRRFIRKDGTPVTLLFGAALLEGSQNKIACFALDLSRYK